MKAKHMKMFLIAAAVAGAFYVYKKRRKAAQLRMIPASIAPALPNVNNTRAWASTTV